LRCKFLILQGLHFCKTAQVAWSAAEASREKCANQLPGQRWADYFPSQTENIHVVIFDALVGGENIMDKPCANTGNFVRNDGGTHAAAAERDSALYLSSSYSSRQWDDGFGIVIGGV